MLKASLRKAVLTRLVGATITVDAINYLTNYSIITDIVFAKLQDDVWRVGAATNPVKLFAFDAAIRKTHRQGIDGPSQLGRWGLFAGSSFWRHSVVVLRDHATAPRSARISVTGHAKRPWMRRGRNGPFSWHAQPRSV